MTSLQGVTSFGVRDKSEGMDKSRFTKRENLFESNIAKASQVETMSQQNIAINSHSDSGEPTACTNTNKQDSEQSVKKGMKQQTNNLVTKPSYTIPTTYVQLSDNKRNQHSNSGLSLRKTASMNQTSTSQTRSPLHGPCLNLQKKLLITIHEISINISSDIDLKLSCSCNDSEQVYTNTERVN